ncbi:MAG: MarR family winged helix-turn-helix transcriptional regulator [Ilumatobacteraceae bacterium]
MNELAAALRVDPSTVTRTLQRMELAGLAERSPDLHDGRAITAHITAAGRECQAMVAARRRSIIGQILVGFDEGGSSAARRVVERFITGANEYAGVPTVPADPEPGAPKDGAAEHGPAATAAG